MEINFTEILKPGSSRKEKARLIARRIRVSKGYSWVGLYDVTEKEISLISSDGRTEPVFTSFPKDKGLNGRAVTRAQTVIVNDTGTDEDYLLTFSDTASEIIVPVFDEKKVVGTIDAESESKNAFSEGDALFLEDCAKEIVSLWRLS